MELKLFKNLKNKTESNVNIKGFIEELEDFLSNVSNKIKNNESDTSEENKIQSIDVNERDKKLQEYRKEGHLYLVTEDRNGKVFLWDLTDKPKNEIEEIDFPKELLDKATEGAVFQYRNGKYEFYSEDGYDMLFEENK